MKLATQTYRRSAPFSAWSNRQATKRNRRLERASRRPRFNSQPAARQQSLGGSAPATMPTTEPAATPLPVAAADLPPPPQQSILDKVRMSVATILEEHGFPNASANIIGQNNLNILQDKAQFGDPNLQQSIPQDVTPADEGQV